MQRGRLRKSGPENGAARCVNPAVLWQQLPKLPQGVILPQQKHRDRFQLAVVFRRQVNVTKAAAVTQSPQGLGGLFRAERQIPHIVQQTAVPIGIASHNLNTMDDFLNPPPHSGGGFFVLR